MKNLLFFWSIVFVFIVSDSLTSSANAYASESPVKRTIIVLYDGNTVSDARQTLTHKMAHAILNHLGLKVVYNDIHGRLPALTTMHDVRGILWWFNHLALIQPEIFFSWATDAIDTGIRLVLMGSPILLTDVDHRPLPAATINSLFKRLGLQYQPRYSELTYASQTIKKNTAMAEFEYSLRGLLPAFGHYQTISKNLKTYLVVRDESISSEDSHLITTGPHGGFVDRDYIVFSDKDGQRFRWRLNPFLFFSAAYATDILPKPDPSTLSNRRIFFAHIDGDGWRSRTKIHKYHKDNISAAEVIVKELITAFPHYPLTVAPIAGDLDPAWYGSSVHQETAKKIFQLPYIEVGSHTYGHPNIWPKPSSSQTVDAENQSFTSRWVNELLARTKMEHLLSQNAASHDDQETRLYNIQPFSVDLEINESIDYINTLLPTGKKVTIMQWSGNSQPSEAAIIASAQAKVYNINQDTSHRQGPLALFSYTTLAPYGLRLGNSYQVYSSAASATFTAQTASPSFFNWRQHAQYTETPRRLTPLNLHYSMAMGETLAKLNTLMTTYRYINGLQLTPIATSHYAAIVNGFESTRLIALAPKQWRIENRGHLQTIRFDKASFLAVDFTESYGVIGQRHYQGSLYTLLDSKITQPIIALKTMRHAYYPFALQSYLLHSNWQINNVAVKDKYQFSFIAQGFGTGNMHWHVPTQGQFQITILANQKVLQTIIAETTSSHILVFDIQSNSRSAVYVNVKKIINATS